MNHLEHTALARQTIEDRIREANQLRLVRECRSTERSSAAPAASEPPANHSHLWSLVHFRQAHT
jgi:hypothetical protein